jgi:hypothetical protein
LRIPVVTRSFSAGDGKVRKRRDHVVRAAEMLVEHLDLDIAFDFRPVGQSERDVLIIVENCAAERHVALNVIPGRREKRRARNL